jgi:predicted DNA-binding transcriptional regulator AlpA
MKVSVIGDASISVDEIEKLRTLPHADIYIEKADFRGAMTINSVAARLGLTVRHLRRMIASGDFPESCLVRGNTHLWLRQTVRTWKKAQLSSVVSVNVV